LCQLLQTAQLTINKSISQLINQLQGFLYSLPQDTDGSTSLKNKKQNKTLNKNKTKTNIALLTASHDEKLFLEKAKWNKNK